MSSMRIGKYARLEVERRYLLADLPHDLDRQEYWEISDRYLTGTRLRLRRMVEVPGGKIVYKLGQKYRGDFQSRAETTMTNLYLDDEEYRRLATLQGREIRKKRYRYVAHGLTYSVDVFEGALSGLVLAEIECDTSQVCEQLHTPPFALRDVTGKSFFTGGCLALLTKEAFAAGMSAWR